MLIELGDPDKLAAGYTDRPLHLIGPRYYLDVVAAAEAAAVDRARRSPPSGSRSARPSRGASFGEVVGSTVVGRDRRRSCTSCFWTTLVFAILERSEPVATARRSLAAVDASTSSPSRANRGARLGRPDRDRSSSSCSGRPRSCGTCSSASCPGADLSVPRPRAVAVVDRRAVRPHGARGRAARTSSTAPGAGRIRLAVVNAVLDRRGRRAGALAARAGPSSSTPSSSRRSCPRTAPR